MPLERALRKQAEQSYEADTSRTLDLNGGSPACNQGGIAIVQDEKMMCLNDQGGERMDVSEDVSGTLRAQDHGHPPVVMAAGFCTEHSAKSRSIGYEDETSPTLRAGVVPAAIALEHHPTDSRIRIEEGDAIQTLTSRMGTGGNQVNALCMDVGFFQTEEEKAGSLLARQYKDPPIVQKTYQEKTDSLMASGYNKLGTQEAANDMYITGSVVRRLTPTECERLQGFPDGWTDIGEWTDTKGKKHKEADSPRYKALGNSIALPFWKYLARRICAQYEREITMGSLFDGIGGFPYAFERCGAKAVWASEIEEFPIAVTKLRFPEE